MLLNTWIWYRVYRLWFPKSAIDSNPTLVQVWRPNIMIHFNIVLLELNIKCTVETVSSPETNYVCNADAHQSLRRGRI